MTHNQTQEIIDNLLLIEEDIYRLKALLEVDSLSMRLHKREVFALLEHIIDLSFKSRKNLLSSDCKEGVSAQSETVVSQKEMQELLELFA